MDFSVKFLIDPKDLNNVKAAQQRITLAKLVNNTDGTPSVIWLSIDPFQSTDVEWTEEYGIYASTVAVAEGAALSKLSEAAIPVQDGAYYSLTPATTFNGPFSGNGVLPGSFGAQNDVPNSAYPMLTFGLTQTALVNHKPAERKPLSATPVLATQFANMTPLPIVYAWLQSQLSSETIITKITGKKAKVKLGGGVKSVTLKYHPDMGMFVSLTDQGQFQLEHPNVELLIPALV